MNNNTGSSSAQPTRPRFIVPSVAAALDAPTATAPPVNRLPPPPPPPPPPATTTTAPPSIPPVSTGPPSRPVWQQRANTNANASRLPPPPGPRFAGPTGPLYNAATAGPPGPAPSQSVYHEGAQPLVASTGQASRADYARKRKALNDEDLFKLPDMPGAYPAPAPGATTTASAGAGASGSSAAPSTNPTAVLAPRASSTTSVGNAILVNTRQRGNPVLDHIHTIAWEYLEATPADYVVGATAGVLFLSVKYHRLHPEYIVQRIRGIQGHFDLRVLLVLVDVGDYSSTVKEMNALCVANDLTLILAWSNEECAKYLELYKSMEHRPPDALMGRQEEDYSSRLTDALTQIKGVNRTDVLTLSATFGTFAKIVQASVTDLASCPGIGDKKAQRIYEAFRKPFIAAADTLPLEED